MYVLMCYYKCQLTQAGMLCVLSVLIITIITHAFSQIRISNHRYDNNAESYIVQSINTPSQKFNLVSSMIHVYAGAISLRMILTF